MRIPLALLLSTIIAQLIVDAYIFRVLRKRIRARKWAHIQLGSSVILLLYLIAVICMPKRSGENSELLLSMWLIYGFLTIYAGKFTYVIVDLLSRLPELWRRPRWRPISYAAVVIGIVTFGAMWWGALINRYRIDVNEITMHVNGLPESFDGYRVVQFSDIHVGTYGNDTTFISRVVDRINALEPDLILFTGDAVNRIASELDAFVPVLSRLKANDGVYSIWGNHDYGGYYDWPTKEDSRNNLRYFEEQSRKAGFRLLGDEYTWIKHEKDSIALIGCHTWGGIGDEKRYRLKLPYPTPDDDNIKILMTHNPNHWVQSIADADSANITLTLSGHTHAMQIKVGRVSPAIFKYKTWSGLYDSPDGRRPLYVNIGIGCVGLPARIGATPEITLITFNK